MKMVLLGAMACLTLAFTNTADVLAHKRLPASPGERPHLKNIYTSSFDLEQLRRDKDKALIFVFLGTECPVAQQYIPRLNEIHKEYAPKGVRVFGIYSDPRVEIVDVARHAQAQDIAFPVFKDVDQRLAEMLEASVTPEVVVVDHDFAKKYQGAIDDQYERGGRKKAASTEYLVDALEAVLADKDVQRSFVRASGCPIERRKPKYDAPENVNFYEHVAPLVAKNCQSCHRDDGPGPFELSTYDDVAMNSEKIRENILDRRMPPWHGELNAKFGKLRNDKRLTEKEIDTIVGWIDAGAPEGERPATGDADSTGEAKRRPANREQWEIGKPDYVYRMPKPFRVPKHGVVDYQFFRVPLNWNADQWFNAVEIKPGQADVVHHITLHVVPASKGGYDGLAAMAQLYGVNGESGNLINDYVPGDTYNAKVYPAGQGVRIPKNSDLVFEVHYTPNNVREVNDQSMVAFRWAKHPPAEEVFTEVFRKPIGRFHVPPHHSHYRVEDTYYFEHDVFVDAIRPHFHLRGKSYRLEMIERNPDTDEVVETTPVLSVPVFDPGWQRTYELETPLRLKAGTELRAIGYFDNSNMNPNNPDPSVEVSWGQQTSDEMFSTRFKYRLIETSKN
jgi:thiol-disulfide isomerase/thioredoxin